MVVTCFPKLLEEFKFIHMTFASNFGKMRMKVFIHTKFLMSLFISSREVRLELLKLARERISLEICQSLIEEKISAEVEEIAEEVLQEAKAERDAKLQLLAGYVIKSRTAKYFERCTLTRCILISYRINCVKHCVTRASLVRFGSVPNVVSVFFV